MKVKIYGFRFFTYCISVVLIFAVLLISGGCSSDNNFKEPLDTATYLSEDWDEAGRNDLKYMEDNLIAFQSCLVCFE